MIQFNSQGIMDTGRKGKGPKNCPKSVKKKKEKGAFSIKHDLARSCFQFWLKIGDEGDKISRKKLARR